MGNALRVRGLAIAVAAILLCAIGTQSASASLTIEIPPTLNDQTRTVRVSGLVKSVVARTDMGHVVVAAGSPSSIRIHETWNYARPTVTHTLRSGVLTVTAKCPNDPVAFNKCSDDLTITVPSAVTVDASSGFGDITTKGLIGNEKLLTNFGDVKAVGVSAWSIAASTNYGNVAFDLVSAPTKASGRSSFGDISMKVPAAIYAVSAKSNWGDVSVKGITLDDEATRHITASSSYGDVTIARR